MSKAQISTAASAADGAGAGARKRPGGGGGEKHPPLLSRYVIFSLTLFAVILIAGSAAYLFSMRQIIRDNKGRELTQLLELERLKLERSVDREIAIVLKMATSPMIRRHFERPDDPELAKNAREDIREYRRAISGSVFWISDTDKMFCYDDITPYPLDVAAPENYWYNMTLKETASYNFNINYNPDLKVMNLWINAPVFDDSYRPVGMLGAGVDLSAFVSAVYTNYHGKARFYFFNGSGEITGAEDVALAIAKKHINDELDGADVMAKAAALDSGAALTFSVPSGQMAVISIPTLGWFAVAALPDSIDDFKKPITVFFFLGILVIALILILSNIFIAGLLTPLRETMLSLEAASKAKSDFLARMSHEIRTPMNAILGIVQIQMQKGDMPEDMENALDKIYNSGNLLLGIINDILDMSKIETGKLKLNPVEYDVPSLINDSVQFNIVRVGSKPIDFKLFVDENLPSKLVGDELRLKQILNNMLSNAIKYTDRGRVSLYVKHTAEGDDVTLVMKVEDTGQGIKEDDLKVLFSEYQRFNAGANRNTEGTGLGLNITRRLVTMMDGWIDVESTYGQGSTFTVTVKQKAVPSAGVIGAELSRKLRNFTFTSVKHSASQKIVREPMPYGSALVVDDVEINLIVASGLLAPYRMKVDTAGSGFDAIEKVRAGEVYDVIFMDHMMPNMDGMEATRALRTLGYTGVIIALTANAILGNEELFTQNGFDGFISKPIDLRKLDAVLNKFVRDRHPEEVAKLKTEAMAGKVKTVTLNARVLEALKRDVAKAASALRSAIESGDNKLLSTTAHGMKSAFAVIGENEISQRALALELAGRNGDAAFISANAENFIKSLEEFTENKS